MARLDELKAEKDRLSRAVCLRCAEWAISRMQTKRLAKHMAQMKAQNAEAGVRLIEIEKEIAELGKAGA